MTTAQKRPHSRVSGAKARNDSAKAKPEHPATPAAASAPRRRIVFVLGMHRSGTSAATRMISMAGASLPRNLVPAGEGNPLGHWEASEAIRFNDEVLSSVGLHWHSLANMPPGWFDTEDAAVLADRAATVLSDELPKDGTLAVFKDPRLCRLAPLWIKAAEKAGWDPVVLLALRNPVEVAASLKSRNGFLPAKSVMLSLKHMLEAERGTRHLPRSVVTYDQILSDWRGALGRIGNDLALRWPRLSYKTEVEIDNYISESQRHHRAPVQDAETGVANWASTVFRLLSAASVGEPLDTAALDQIAERLAAAETVFGPLLAMTEASAAAEAQQAAGLAGQVVGLHQKVASQAEALAEQQRRGAELQAEVGRLAGALAASQGEATSLRTEVERSAQALHLEETLRQEAASLTARLAAAEAERDAANGRAAGLDTRLAEAEAAQVAACGEADATRQELAALSGRLTEAEAARAAARQDVTASAEQLRKVEAERDAALRRAEALDKRLASVAAAHCASLQDIEASALRLADMEAQIEALSADRSEREQYIQQLRTTLEKLSNQNALQSNTLAEHQVRFAKVETHLVSLFDQINRLERENEELGQEKAQLQQERQHLQQEKQHFLHEAEQLRQALALVESERSAIDLPGLVGDRNAQAHRAALLDRQRAELELALTRSEEENRSLHAAMGTLSTRNDMLNQQVADHLTRFAQIEESVGLLYRQIQQLEQEKHDLAHHAEAIGAGLESRDKQIANLIQKALLYGVGVYPEGFDKDFYLTCNPDVLDAIQNGQLASAFEHWLLWGAWEGRTTSFRPVQPMPGVDPGLVRGLALLEDGKAPHALHPS